MNLVHPNFVLIFTISWVIFRGLDEGLTIALFAGLSLDFTSGAPFGVFSLTMVMVAIATNFAHDWVFGHNSLLLPASLILPASFLFNSLALLLMDGLGRPVVWTDTVSHIITPVAFLNTAVMLPLFGLIYVCNKALDPPEAVSL